MNDYKKEFSALQSWVKRHHQKQSLGLKAEVKDLKEGLSALEERARNDLGMIGSNETFYQVADGASGPVAPIPPAQPSAPGMQRISR